MFYWKLKKEIIQSCNVQIKNSFLLRVQNLLEVVDKDVYDIGIIHRCTTDTHKIKKHTAYLQTFEHIYEQSSATPVKFLLLIHKGRFLYIHDCPFIKKHAKLQRESPSKKNVITTLMKVKQPTISNTRIGNERLLKLMSTIELYQYFTVPNCEHCYHISCVSSDLVWVSVDEHKLILVNKEGVVLKHLKDYHMGFCVRTHSVNSQGEMIYLDKQNCIRKLSQDMKTTTIIEQPHSCYPECVYLSPSTGNLLVVMRDSRRNKLFRCNNAGELTQTILLDDYEMPCYFVTVTLMEILCCHFSVMTKVML